MNFETEFKNLTGRLPFPWQRKLFDRWLNDPMTWPTACVIPTGLGKTAVVQLWWLAWKQRPDIIPRRLVYVVNRRTVVDQTTAEVESLRRYVGGPQALGISTLRGQFADNREWSADPARPAVIVGTVDMIGSRLLFSGYGSSFKLKPLHAGFLGQDVLLIHDEAHLEPAFQKLLEAIVQEQQRAADKSVKPFHVLQLTATVRQRDNEVPDESKILRLGDEELLPASEITEPSNSALDEVRRRLGSVKRLTLVPVEPKKIADEVIRRALELEPTGRAVLIFMRTVKDVENISAALRKQIKQPSNEESRVATLTGTMRGYEREQLIQKPVFRRFLPRADEAKEQQDPTPPPMQGTVYLVSTSAGEVGVNLSADDLICDLSTLESMAQRFGRVNRFGTCTDTRIDVCYPEPLTDKEPLAEQLRHTLDMLRRLNGDASPRSLSLILNSPDADAAFSPAPKILPVDEILFDAWSLTSIRSPLPGRPPVEPYLHGEKDGEAPQTRVAWREEVEKIGPEYLMDQSVQDLLDDYPLKPHELLTDDSRRVHEHVAALAKRHPDAPAWLVSIDGKVEAPLNGRSLTLEFLADKNQRERLDNMTLLLPPFVGGLREGLLNGDDATPVEDVADQWGQPANERPWKPGDTYPTWLRRARIWSTVNAEEDAPPRNPRGMRIIRRITLGPSGEESGESEEMSASVQEWLWCERIRGDGEASTRVDVEVLLEQHTNHVTEEMDKILKQLPLPDDLKRALRWAARGHDLGKARRQFQRALGNPDFPGKILAKSGPGNARSRLVGDRYRHEFGSLFEMSRDPEFLKLGSPVRELALHLVAAHHGRARPHFAADEAIDPLLPVADCRQQALETLQRFARLQRRFGRWGLAYLESLLRAADYAASAADSRTGTLSRAEATEVVHAQ